MTEQTLTRFSWLLSRCFHLRRCFRCFAPLLIASTSDGYDASERYDSGDSAFLQRRSTIVSYAMSHLLNLRYNRDTYILT